MQLQSYILSTTTETSLYLRQHFFSSSFNRTSFQQQLKHYFGTYWNIPVWSFNRTSFQQQLKHLTSKITPDQLLASIVHPFNNNWNIAVRGAPRRIVLLQSYILSTTTETKLAEIGYRGESMLQSYILSTTTETSIEGMTLGDIEELQSYILSTTTETTQCFFRIYFRLSLQSYILSTTTETISP